MAWIDVTQGETAQTLATRLTTAGAKTDVSEDSNSVIVNACATTVLRQIQTVKTHEYRGLTKAAAKLLRGLKSDNTQTVTLYSTAGQNARTKDTFVCAQVTTGQIVNVAALRSDESGKWVARVTETTFTWEDGNPLNPSWSTSVPQYSTTGRTVSKYSRMIKHSLVSEGLVICRFYQIVQVTVKEYPYLTKSSAEAKLANAVDNTTQNFRPVYDLDSVLHRMEYITGEKKSYDMRFVSDVEGWTVTETSEVYGSPLSSTDGSQT